MVHLHNGILLSHEKEGNLTLCDSMDEPGEHYAQWSKLVKEVGGLGEEGTEQKTQTFTGMDNSVVIAGVRGRGGAGVYRGMKCDGRGLDLGGEHTLRCTDDVL